MGRQWNQIIESLGPLSGGTGLSINANLTEIEALLTTLQADVADGITVSSGTVTANGGDFAGTDGAPPPNKFVPIAFVDGSGTGNLVRVGNDSAGLPINLIEASNFSAQNNDPNIPPNGFQIGFVDANNEFRHVQESVPFPISGTVTATPTRGTTTTGTLTAGTTNGTLFAANANRNYLCVQCTSGTVFIDTNGTASATDDIQLTSGQGITWEGSFIPTGAIAAITSTGTARIVGIQG